MKVVVAVVLLLFVIPVVFAQDCVVPESAMIITEDTQFCSGLYELDEGIVLSGVVSLDCNGAQLKGAGRGAGILVREYEDVSIENCDVTDFEVGVYLEKTENAKVSDNSLTENRFGVVLYETENDVIENNVIENNSRTDTITVSPVQLFEVEEEVVPEAEEEVEEQEVIEEVEEQQVEEKLEPKEVIERTVRVKNPSMDDSEIDAAVAAIYDEYFGRTQEYVDFKRSYFFNESDNTTRIFLRIIPKKPLENVTVYEHIPKCIAQLVDEISFETQGYEVIEEDPLIVWHFDELDQTQLISYEVLQRIDESCKELLVEFGIATVFDSDEDGRSFGLVLPLVVIISLIVVVVYYRSRKR